MKLSHNTTRRFWCAALMLACAIAIWRPTFWLQGLLLAFAGLVLALDIAQEIALRRSPGPAPRLGGTQRDELD